jgi:hypothetical protein
MLQKNKSKELLCIATTTIIIGIVIFFTSIFYYPISLPKIVSSGNSEWIQDLGYIFYGLLISSIILFAYGIRQFVKIWQYKVFGLSSEWLSRNSVDAHASLSYLVVSSSSLLSSLFALLKIIVSIICDKRYSKFFYLLSIGYGIFYALVSGMLIYRPDINLSSLYGVPIPSIIMTSYGPTGYVPTMSIYVTDHLGFFIIPLNLLVALVISALVGFNGVLSIFAFSDRRRRRSKINVDNGNSNSNKSMNKPAKDSLGVTSSILNAAGATVGIFAVCPTCASFYILSIFTGSLVPTITTFTVTFYSLFLIITIPLLLLSPLLTAWSIRKNILLKQCSLLRRRTEY